MGRSYQRNYACQQEVAHTAKWKDSDADNLLTLGRQTPEKRGK
jgi:hypothetical protein